MSTKYTGTDREIAVLDSWIKLARASGSIFRTIRPTLEKHGLTIPQFGTLETLWHLGPMSQKEIGKKLLVTDANVVRVIDNLERDKRVERVPMPSDRRSNLIQLTSTGESLIKTVFDEHVQDMIRIYQALPDRDVKKLADLCKILGLGITPTSDHD